jgi:uncharacterized protein YbjT (DUF2867 family)
VSKTLVIGANGTVGSELVRLLQSTGQSVSKATSRPAVAADDVHLNLVSGAGIAAAFEGVDRAFLLSPPGFTNQDQLLGPLINEALQRKLRKVVLMSAMGANADPNGPLRKAELQLEQSGVPYNIIRPNWFMQNFNSYWIQGILEHGKIFLPVGKARGSFIDARDIAAVAAALLVRSDLDNRDFDLTGGEALDHDAVAALLSRETGRSIAFEHVTPEAMLQGLLGAGLPAAYAQFLIVILGYFKAGYAERITDAVPTILGRAPISFAQYAKDYRAAWLAVR